MRAHAVAAVVLLVLLTGCFGTTPRSEWAYEVTQLDQLANQAKTGAGVTIAILDTGIDVTHPTLDHLVDGSTDNGELTAFKDFLTGQQGVANAYDDDGHGTHVSAIIAARPSGVGDKLLSGGVALRGGAPGADLLVARVCNADACDVAAIRDAVRWAADNNADVISLSLGGNPNLPGLVGDQLQDALAQEINRAIDRGVVVVAAAGNDGKSAGDVAAPSNIPGVISVASMAENLTLAPSSQRGDGQANQCRTVLLQVVGRCHPNQKPEIAAPGVDILSAWVDGTYATASGTSQATPFVSSAVALLLEGRPDLTSRSDVKDVKTALVDSARDLPGQVRPHDNGAGYGMLQARNALVKYA